ncbi:MAG: NAD(P)-binding domain-containing protein, partial [Bacteroidota bacterium]
MKILIIGGGNMGKTYARSLLRAHLVQPEDLMVLERSPEQA